MDSSACDSSIDRFRFFYFSLFSLHSDLWVTWYVGHKLISASQEKQLEFSADKLRSAEVTAEK